MRGLLAACILLTFTPQANGAPATGCDPGAPRSGEPYSEYSARSLRKQCRKPWTVLVYMAADNDLAPFALWDLREMEGGYKSGRVAAGSTARADLVVQLAFPGEAQARRLHVFQSDEIYDSAFTIDDFRRKRRGLGDVRSPVAAMIPRTENGAAVAPALDFERFLEWGIREYPSEHYLVIVWGHGEGWVQSDSRSNTLDIPGLRHALRTVERKLLGGRPIDVYVADSCLMQTIEVATELSDSARFIVGSSQVQNYLGLPYRRLMFELNTGRLASQRGVTGLASADEPYLVARMLPLLFRSSLRPGGLHGRELPRALETATLSAISAEELRGLLLPALGRVARALTAYLDEDGLRAISLTQGLRETPGFMGGTQELGGFLRMLEYQIRLEAQNSPATIELGRAIVEATRALDRTVLSYALGHRYSGAEADLYLLGFRALAVWLPQSKREYNARIVDFSSSVFYHELAGAWEGWLARLYGEPAASLLTSGSSGNSRLSAESNSLARSAWPSLR